VPAPSSGLRQATVRRPHPQSVGATRQARAWRSKRRPAGDVGCNGCNWAKYRGGGGGRLLGGGM
jgi:hypothetical protein